MKSAIILAIMTLTAGCATTSGAIPLGPDTYMITREAGSAFVGTTGIRNDALKEASAHCQAMSRQMKIVGMQEVPGGPFVYPRADVHFMCLKEGDAQLTRPVMGPAPTSIVEVRNR